jgi:hypothetical protein
MLQVETDIESFVRLWFLHEGRGEASDRHILPLLLDGVTDVAAEKSSAHVYNASALHTLPRKHSLVDSS